jgi:hypothetical protein
MQEHSYVELSKHGKKNKCAVILFFNEIQYRHITGSSRTDGIKQCSDQAKQCYFDFLCNKNFRKLSSNKKKPRKLCFGTIVLKYCST